MKHKILLLGAWLCVSAGLWAETTLDIDGAVKLALEKNLSLERSRIDRDAAQRKYGRSWNSLLPSLGAGVLASRPAPVIAEIPAGADQWTPGFSLSASVQLSLSAIMHVEQAKADYEAGILDYEAARQDLDFQVRLLYYQLLLLRANAELAERNAESAQVRYEQIRAQYRNGHASNLDELSARLDAQTQATNVQSALTAYDNALDGLKQLVMIAPEEKVTLRGSLQNLSIDETELKNSVPGESPRMGAARKNIASLEARRKAARTDAYVPQLNFSWNTAPVYSDTSGEWADNGQFSVTLSMKLDNLFPWSPAKEQIDTLGDSIAAGQNALQETALNSRNAVQKLRRNISQSAAAIKTLRLNLNLAGENQKMYEEAYRNGAADLQSLYSARDNVFIAHNKILSEQYNLMAAILELEKELNLPFGSIGRFDRDEGAMRSEGPAL